MANFNFNKVILGGRLTATPELKRTQSGVSVTSFNIAVNRKGKDAPTDFLDIVAWRQTAEIICQYFKKGSSICIVGTLQKREWTDKNGQKRYETEVIAEEVTFVDSKSETPAEEAAPANSIPAADTQWTEAGENDDLPF